ncbi:hypothetical protein A8H26_21750 [Pluralibacter gergoviae]|nr:hypothetical protein A8H26_21750 [Pluralibacter gergoviae]
MHRPVEDCCGARSSPEVGKCAILAAVDGELREESHRDGNGYITYINDCDRDRYLDVLTLELPAARRVSWRHSHSAGPWRK